MTLPSWTDAAVGSPQRWQSLLLTALLATTLLGALSWMSPSVAHADPAADAEAMIARGIELRRDGQDAAALEAFQRAAQLHSTPRALAQIGLAQQALGRWLEAEFHLKAALEHADDGWIRRNTGALQRSLSAIGERLGSVELTCDVAGAAVVVNGAPTGQTPLREPLRVVAGTVVIEVTADGYHPMTRSLQVNAGALARETVTLVPVRAGVAPPPDPTPASTTATPVAAPQADDERAPIVRRERVVVRTHAMPQPSTPSAPVAEPAAEPEAVAAEGGEFSLYVGYGGFLRRGAGLFTTAEEGGPRAMNLGLVGQLAIGYRPIRWLSFGAHVFGSLQEGNGEFWSARDADAQLYALSTGVYVRGHIVNELRAGAVDLWLGTGFHPFSRVWVDVQSLPNYRVDAVAIPLELGVAVFGSTDFALELKFSTLHWLPLEYCVNASGHNVCGASMKPQTSWDVALGVSWVL